MRSIIKFNYISFIIYSIKVPKDINISTYYFMARSVSILVLALLLVNLSNTWWDIGHMTVAQVA